jgi:hypothetical protein
MKVVPSGARGVASLPDMECDFVSAATGRPHDLIVISGPPASGKTRLLELMLAVLELVGPYQGIVRASDGLEDPDARRARRARPLPGGRGPSSVVAAGADCARRRAASARAACRPRSIGPSPRLSRYDHDPAHGKREYFPEDRQRAWGARATGSARAEQALMRCSKDPQKYSFVPRFLAELRTDPRTRRASPTGSSCSRPPCGIPLRHAGGRPDRLLQAPRPHRRPLRRALELRGRRRDDRRDRRHDRA